MELISILEQISDEELYSTPFVEALKVQIMLRTIVLDFCVLPFLIQIVFSLVYFSLYALREEPEISWLNFLLQVIVTITSLYFSGIEYLQFREFYDKKRKSLYFYSPTNLVDFTSVLFNLVIILNERFAR